MKRLLAPLLISASLLTPVEAEAKETLTPINWDEVTPITRVEKIAPAPVFAQVQQDTTTEDEMSDGEAIMIGILVIIGLGVALYMLPTIVASMVGSHLTVAIFIINLFLGWSLIGWVVALAMAFIPRPKRETIIINQSQSEPVTTQATPSGVEKIQY